MMKYHIRSLAIILSLVMIFSVASVGCRSNDDSSTTSTVSSKTERKKKIIVIKKKREPSDSSSTSSSSDSQNTVDNNQQGNNNPNNNQTVTEKIPVAVNKTFAPLTSAVICFYWRTRTEDSVQKLFGMLQRLCKLRIWTNILMINSVFM